MGINILPLWVSVVDVFRLRHQREDDDADHRADDDAQQKRLDHDAHPFIARSE